MRIAWQINGRITFTKNCILMVLEVTNSVRSGPVHFAMLSEIISPVDSLVFCFFVFLIIEGG